MKPKEQSPWLIITALLIWAILLASPAVAASMKTNWVRYPTPEVVLGEPVDRWGCNIKADSQGRVYTAGICNFTSTNYFMVYGSNGSELLDGATYRTGLPSDGFLPRLTLDSQEKLYFSGNNESNKFFIHKYEWVEYHSTDPPMDVVRLELKWGISFGTGGQSLGPIAVDDAGYVYAAVNNSLYKFYPEDGTSAGGPWPTGVKNVTGIALDEQYVYITGGNFTTEKYDNAGGLQWTQTLDPYIPGADMQSVALALDDQGNVFVTGTEDYWGGPNNVQSQIHTVKYNSAGQQQWASESRGGRFRDYHNGGAGLVVDGQGNAYVTGTALDPNTYFHRIGFRHDNDFYTVKYAPDGTILWERYFDGSSSNDGAAAIAMDSAGNLVVTGTCKVFPDFPSLEPPTSQMATVCYTPDGQRRWVEYFKGPRGSTENEARALAVRSWNVYVSGSSKYKDYTEAPDTWHWVAIKYSSPGKKELRPRP
jgi:hypothetical protein